jgi:hypothetical protein
MTERETLLEKYEGIIRALSNFSKTPGTTLEEVQQRLDEALSAAVAERRGLMTAGRNTLATRGV